MTNACSHRSRIGCKVWSAPVPPAGIEIKAPVEECFDAVLSDDALSFVAALHARFDERRRDLLARRAERRARLAAGELLDFLPETREVRDGDWQVAPVSPPLQDRRVEITGPTD